MKLRPLLGTEAFKLAIIHLSGRELADKLEQTLATVDTERLRMPR
jgi:hypothetical protein